MMALARTGLMPGRPGRSARDRLVDAADRAADRAAAAIVPARWRQPLLRRMRLLLQRGNRVECPVCSRRWRRFKDDWNRPEAICWWCGSHERHRALFLYMRERTPLLSGPSLRLLHFAPEYFVGRALAAVHGEGYLSADLEAGAAMEAVDITAIPHPDDSFDAIVCSHVLEHVGDDRRGMRELARVLRPDGLALVLVPQDLERAETYEDPAIASPAQRLREYGQSDHMRLYGRDFAARLGEAELVVREEDYVGELGEGRIARHGLVRSDRIFRCTKR